MFGAEFGYDVMTFLRVGTMLVFIAAFVGLCVWLLRPGAKRRSDEDAMIPLRDDRPAPRPEARPKEHR